MNLNRHYVLLLLMAILMIPSQDLSAKKKKQVKEPTDRELWAEVLYRMAEPVLSNMSEGKLQQNMLVELSPTWDGRNKKVTYMECFGRLLAGLAPLISLPDDVPSLPWADVSSTALPGTVSSFGPAVP